MKNRNIFVHVTNTKKVGSLKPYLIHRLFLAAALFESLYTMVKY